MSKDDQAAPVSITRDFAKDLQLVEVERGQLKELFITALPTGTCSNKTLLAKVADLLGRNDARIVSQDIFAGLNGDSSIMQTMLDTVGKVSWPVTWLDSGNASNFAGTHIWAVSGPQVKRIESETGIIGTVFEDNYARYCRLGGLSTADRRRVRNDQAAEIFEQMGSALGKTGFELSNIVRTWFYLDDILDWYGDFNKIRDTFFARKGIFDALVPASTGIGGGNIAGSALVGGLIAYKPKTNKIKAGAVPSPLQCPALDYGSSFSRACEIVYPCHRRLFVSGTASIAPEGHTIHVGDVDAQIAKTMEVVEAILQLRGMDWGDVTRGIAYLRDASDIPAYDKYCRERDLPTMPVVPINSTVCRKDLLFEIEVDTIKST